MLKSSVKDRWKLEDILFEIEKFEKNETKERNSFISKFVKVIKPKEHIDLSKY